MRDSTFIRKSILSGAGVMSLGALACAGEIVEQPGWRRFFDECGVDGTIIVVDERDNPGVSLVFGSDRAGKRFSPASTFKIPHALFALDAGVVRDEFRVIRWDGEKRASPAWNHDQNLRSSMRHSVVWVHQRFAAVLLAACS